MYELALVVAVGFAACLFAWLSTKVEKDGIQLLFIISSLILAVSLIAIASEIARDNSESVYTITSEGAYMVVIIVLILFLFYVLLQYIGNYLTINKPKKFRG